MYSFVAADLQQHGERFGAVGAVVDNQDAKASGGRGRGDGLPRGRLRHFSRDRQTHDELAAAAKPAAVRFDGSALQFHERPDQGEPDAQAVARALQRRIDLGKHVEEARQFFGRDADAVVPHSNHGLPAFQSGAQPDVPASVGELAGVVQQVADHLRKARGVGLEVDGLRWQCHRQLVIHARVEGPRGFEGLADDGHQVDAFGSKIDLAARHAAHVEQVVHQARHLSDLAFEHFVRRMHCVEVGFLPIAALEWRC